jgi:hypothetical protein
MDLSTVGHAVVIVGVVSALLLLSMVAVTATFVVRVVRRRYRAVRSWLQPPGFRPMSRSDLPAARAAAATTLGSPAWWAVQRDRHRMWRAVSSAEHAVAVARGAGAPVGDLPILSRQLTSAAAGVDALLRASSRTRSLRREAVAERRQVESAAADLYRAALDSLRVAAAAGTEPVLSAVRLEVEALAAGVRAIRQTSQGSAL